jgi:hypothetical protein
MKFIQIFKDGKMDEITHASSKLKGKKIINYFHKISTSQGSGDIKKLYTWDYEKTKITCYGWYDGDCGYNSHELPISGHSDFIDEDSSIKKIYGDIFILKHDDNGYLDINISEYSVFYSNQFEYYGDYNLDDESEDEIEKGVVVKVDILVEECEIINQICNELEYDNNEY